MDRVLDARDDKGGLKEAKETPSSDKEMLEADTWDSGLQLRPCGFDGRPLSALVEEAVSDFLILGSVGTSPQRNFATSGFSVLVRFLTTQISTPGGMLYSGRISGRSLKT